MTTTCCDDGYAPRKVVRRGRAWYECATCARDVSLATILIWKAGGEVEIVKPKNNDRNED